MSIKLEEGGEGTPRDRTKDGAGLWAASVNQFLSWFFWFRELWFCLDWLLRDHKLVRESGEVFLLQTVNVNFFLITSCFSLLVTSSVMSCKGMWIFPKYYFIIHSYPKRSCKALAFCPLFLDTTSLWRNFVCIVYKLPALRVCGHLVDISWKQDTLLTGFSPQLLSISVPVQTTVNWKVYTKNLTKYKSWIFMLSILLLQTENNFIMRNLSNVPKIINCMLFNWSVNALMISRHKYRKSIQSHLAFYRRNIQGSFQQCLNKQVQAESLFWKSPPCHQSFRKKITESMFLVGCVRRHRTCDLSFVLMQVALHGFIYLFNLPHTYTYPLKKVFLLLFFFIF